MAAFPCKRVFSGVQPTGQLHLGNYLGALLPFSTMQKHYQCLFCIVDLHAITSPQNYEMLAENTRRSAAALLASGINHSLIYPQSAVPIHAELGWILGCTARMGWLERMTQFKDKAGKDSERASVGLFSYPILQAADILGFRASHVPVGEDQKQHLELARDIAARFNKEFGPPEIFPLPEPVIRKSAARIMSLKDGSKKMSKSDPSDMSRINLEDNADTISRKIRKAKTDNSTLPELFSELEQRPEAANLIRIFAALDNSSPDDALQRFAGQGFAGLKRELADLIISRLEPVSRRFAEIISDTESLDNLLLDGAEQAHAISEPIMKEIRHAIGFWNKKNA